MAKKQQSEVIKELQNDRDYIILNNPLAIPKFVRTVGKQGKEVALNEVYTPKIFFEIVSQLTPQHLTDTENEYISIDFSIGEFLKAIGTKNTNNDYNHVINCIKEMQKLTVNFENEEHITGFSIIPYFKYEKRSGKIKLDIRRELAQSILQVKQSENFSFLKKHLFRLENAQAIKLFPFFVSWKNKGMIEMKVLSFKKKFGYDTSGYKIFDNFKRKVLEPAIKEINDKTDLFINYKFLGENLTGARPRITGLQFFIKEKEKTKELPPPQRAEKPLFEEVETPPRATEPTPSQRQNEFLDEIFRVFLIFEPHSTAENVKEFLNYFDNQKAVLEACLYAEQEKVRGYEIKNFRGYLIAGIPKGLGVGILEQRTKEQDKKNQIEQKHQAEKEKAVQLETLIKQAEILRDNYKKSINQVLKDTATETEKENIAEILRGQSSIYAKRSLDDFRKPMLIGIFIGKFIDTYPERFETVQSKFKGEYSVMMSEIQQLDKSKVKELHY